MEERETFEDGATRTAMAAHEEWARDHPEQARVMQAERAVMLRQQHAEQAEAQAQLLQQQLFVQQQMLAQQTAQLQAAQLQLQAQLQQQGEQQKLLVARTSSASEQQPPDAGPRERRGSLQALEQIQKLAAAQALQEKGKVDFATAVQASAMFTFGMVGEAAFVMVRDWLDNTKARPSPRNVEAEMMEEAMTAEALANLEADSRKNAALSALSARQKMFRAKSMRKLERAKSVREMVAGLRDVGRLDEAENLARKILSARRQMYGNEHVATANAINQLGSVLTHKARYGDAMIEFQKAIACTRVALGPDSMCEANISHNQACVALMQAEQKSGDLRRLLLEEAARYGRKAADISERRLGVKHEKAQQMRRTWGL